MDLGLGTRTPTHARGVQHHDHGNSLNSEPGLSTPGTFEAVLSATRVYDRVRNRGVDDRTSIATTRSVENSPLGCQSFADSFGMIHALVFHALIEFHLFRQPTLKPLVLIIRLVPQFLDATEEDIILHLAPKPRGPVDGPFPPRRCQLEPL